MLTKFFNYISKKKKEKKIVQHVSGIVDESREFSMLHAQYYQAAGMRLSRAVGNERLLLRPTVLHLIFTLYKYVCVLTIGLYEETCGSDVA